MPNTSLKLVGGYQRNSEAADSKQDRRLSSDQKQGIYNSVVIHGRPPLSVARLASININQLCDVLVEVALSKCRAACTVARLNGQRSMLPTWTPRAA